MGAKKTKNETAADKVKAATVRIRELEKNVAVLEKDNQTLERDKDKLIGEKERLYKKLNMTQQELSFAKETTARFSGYIDCLIEGTDKRGPNLNREASDSMMNIPSPPIYRY